MPFKPKNKYKRRFAKGKMPNRYSMLPSCGTIPEEHSELEGKSEKELIQ